MPYQRSHMYFREVTAARKLAHTTHITNVRKDFLPASLWTIVAALLIWGIFYLVAYLEHAHYSGVSDRQLTNGT